MIILKYWDTNLVEADASYWAHFKLIPFGKLLICLYAKMLFILDLHNSCRG